MVVDLFHSALRILSGFAKELSGRTIGNGSMVAFGRVDQLVGQAVLVSVRARSRGIRN